MFVVVPPPPCRWKPANDERDEETAETVLSLLTPPPTPAVPDICQRHAVIKAILRPSGVCFIDWPCFRVRSPANLIDLT